MSHASRSFRSRGTTVQRSFVSVFSINGECVMRNTPEDVRGVRPDRVCAVHAIFRRRCRSGLDEVDGKDERGLEEGHGSGCQHRVDCYRITCVV